MNADNQRKFSAISARICKIRDKFCYGDNTEFAAKLGVSTSQTSNLCGGKFSVGKSSIEKILNAFPEVSKDWRVNGEGAMLRTDSSTQKSRVNGDNSGIIVQHGDNSTYNNHSELLSVVHSQQETIKSQQEMLNRQSEQISTLLMMLEKK